MRDLPFTDMKPVLFDRLKNESWRWVKTSPRHAVSDRGRVAMLTRRTKTYGGKPVWRLVTPFSIRGYPTVALHLPGGVRRVKMIQVLVLEAFVGPRPKGCVADHSRCSRREVVDLDNLRWRNKRDKDRELARRKGRGKE